MELVAKRKGNLRENNHRELGLWRGTASYRNACCWIRTAQLDVKKLVEIVEENVLVLCLVFFRVNTNGKISTCHKVKYL